MKIITTSDTFGVLPEIEESSDIFIHCGNFCPILEKHQSLDVQLKWLDEEFVPWLDKVPAEFKVIMPGNKDLAVEYLEPNFQYHIGAIFLKDQAATINKLVFYGIPWTPYAVKKDGEVKLYSARNEKIYESILNKIPEQTNVLLTRTSPLGILDKIDGISMGDKKLSEKIKQLPDLKMHLFSFSSDEGGQYLIKDKILFANTNVGQPGYIGIESV